MTANWEAMGGCLAIFRAIFITVKHRNGTDWFHLDNALAGAATLERLDAEGANIATERAEP